jgi:hypothetical protein
MAPLTANFKNYGKAPFAAALSLLLTALTGLVGQIALTRIMSVTVGYHFAFLIISIVMLSMAAAAIAVFQGRRRKNNPLTISSSITAAHKAALFTVAGGLILILKFPGNALGLAPIQFLASVLCLSIGFFHSGFVIILILDHYVRDVARLYWLDLLGAAMGCLLTTFALNRISALSLVVGCAAGLAFAGMLLAVAYRIGPDWKAGAGLATAIALFGIATVARPDVFRLRYAKGQDQSAVKWERWNALARVTVSSEVPGVREAADLLSARQGTGPSPDAVEQLRRLWQVGWGTSAAYRGQALPSLWLQLDADAGTPILQGGVAALSEPGKLDFLSWDVTSVAYVWLRKLGRRPDQAFIIGGGGGRDVLTALAFDSQAVDVVELNPAVVEAVERAFGDFSGRIYSHPRVRLSVGEARYELSHRQTRYDLIQMSMIDTWAASMAGSLVMTENGLYTQQAFDLYLRRLKETGVLSVSRWYDSVRFGETARVAVLMAHTLRRAGIERPEEHLAVFTSSGFLNSAVATLLMRRSPFTLQEHTAMKNLAVERGYQLLWPQQRATAGAPFDLAGLIRMEQRALVASPFDLSPPTDDRPFFFNIDRPISSWFAALRSGDFSQGSRAMMLLVMILLLLFYSSYLFILRPLQFLPQSHAADLKSSWQILAYFGGIGLGFMLVEVALIQRYILFLGHPSYAISVVLFSLLLFGGCGSFLSERIPAEKGAIVLAGVLAGILLTALAIPSLLDRLSAWPWAGRAALATGLIAPLALVMGMLFPSGVRRLILLEREAMLPWMWGINGICSVVASVLGMALAMNINYTAVLFAAAAAYAMAFFWLRRPGR